MELPPWSFWKRIVEALNAMKAPKFKVNGRSVVRDHYNFLEKES